MKFTPNGHLVRLRLAQDNYDVIAGMMAGMQGAIPCKMAHLKTKILSNGLFTGGVHRGTISSIQVNER
jgi:hypothetical protein